jgi:hypothetical protein
MKWLATQEDSPVTIPPEIPIDNAARQLSRPMYHHLCNHSSPPPLLFRAFPYVKKPYRTFYAIAELHSGTPPPWLRRDMLTVIVCRVRR